MTDQPSPTKRILSLYVFAVLLIGCGAMLLPAPGVKTLPGNNTAAVAEAAGVRVIVLPNRWSGSPVDLQEIATPLRVKIENGSNQPLPRGFTLASYYRIRDGNTFEPRHPWDYDEYTPTYNLLEFPLPTEDMLDKGIPEGVLEPGSDISGFLYFSKHEWRRVTFTMNLVDANTGKPFGTIRIPFVVA